MGQFFTKSSWAGQWYQPNQIARWLVFKNSPEVLVLASMHFSKYYYIHISFLSPRILCHISMLVGQAALLSWKCDQQIRAQVGIWPSCKKLVSTVLVAQSRPTLCNPMYYIACQASLSMEFSWQEYWSGLPFPSPEELPNSGIKPWSPASQADSLLFELQGNPS